MNNQKSRVQWFVNNNIKLPRVLCIDQSDKNLGIISTNEALKIAQSVNLDLVQVGPPNKDKIPTCKIMDFGKFKFEQSKKQKELEKKQRESIVKTKEIKFRPNTGLHDLEIKAKQTEEFLKNGFKVKITIMFIDTFKRMTNKQEVGKETLDTFLSLSDNFHLDGKPSLEGNNFIAHLK